MHFHDVNKEKGA